MNFLVFVFSALQLHAFISVEDFNKDTSPNKVLVFLSDQCPCSRSHVSHLNQLRKKHANIPIYAVASEPMNEEAAKYYSADTLDLPVIKDEAQVLVKKYKALKTPHATLLKRTEKQYKVVYQGGVSNKAKFPESTVQYLAENLKAIQSGSTLPHANGYSLGCYIRRY